LRPIQPVVLIHPDWETDYGTAKAIKANHGVLEHVVVNGRQIIRLPIPFSGVSQRLLRTDPSNRLRPPPIVGQ